MTSVFGFADKASAKIPPSLDTSFIFFDIFSEPFEFIGKTS